MDLLVAGTSPGSPLLEGTPAVLATVRGGNYGVGTPREAWDHSTAYLRLMLADVWGAERKEEQRRSVLL